MYAIRSYYVENPRRPWKRAVFSQYARDKKKNRHDRHGDFMGYAMRTDQYRNNFV